jgi:hypothetical protein
VKKLENENEKKINVAVVLTATLEEWRELEVFLNEKCSIIYVKRAPFPVKLKVKEEISRERGEKNGRFSYSNPAK